MTKITKKEMKKIENLGWSIEETEDGYILENYSPAGENLVIEERSKEDIITYCSNFDVDEHFELWYGANRGEPSSPKDLLEDCEAIEEMLNQLQEVLEQC